MTSTTPLTFTIWRHDPDLRIEQLVAVGAGIVDTDEMSWDEHLLARATWLPEYALDETYQPDTDVVVFSVFSVTDPADRTTYFGSGPFPLRLDKQDP